LREIELQLSGATKWNILSSKKQLGIGSSSTTAPAPASFNTEREKLHIKIKS